MGFKRRERSSKPEDFEIGERRLAPGTRARLELPVARLPVGAWLSLPVEVVHGSHPGPTIWLSAAIHGDELVGIPIVRRILGLISPESLHGTLIAVPVVNVFGLVNESRYLPDRRDLNRCFPGTRRGSLASQIANLFMNEVVSRCELGVDLHTGSRGRVNLPQIRCNSDEPATLEAADEFGAPVVLHARLRDGSLRAAADELGVRCLLYEAGEAGRLDGSAIEHGVDGVLRVMAHLGMTRGTRPPRARRPAHFRKSRWIRSPRSGLVELGVQLGDRVVAGQILGKVYNVMDERLSTVKAPIDGLVIGHQATAVVHRGDAIIHLGEGPADDAGPSGA